MVEIIKETYPHTAVTGIDPDTHILMRTKQRFQKKSIDVTVQYGLAEKLPLSSGFADVCFSMLTIHHMPTETKRAAFKEMYRVLKPNGRLILTDWGKPPIPSLRWLLLFEKQAYLDDHINDLLPAYIEEAGLDIINSRKVKMTGMYTWTCEKLALQTQGI